MTDDQLAALIVAMFRAAEVAGHAAEAAPLQELIDNARFLIARCRPGYAGVSHERL